MIQNLLVACGLALSVGVSSLNSNDHNTESMQTQSTTIYDGGVTTVTTQYQYQTNEVNSISDLVVGNIYKFIYLGNHLNNDANYISVKYIRGVATDEQLIEFSKLNAFNVGSYVSSNNTYFVVFKIGYGSTLRLDFIDDTFYAVYNSNYLGSDLFNYFNVTESDYLGSYVSEVTNVMPTSLLEIFDNFINERIFNHSTLATLKTTIFGQEMSVASWLSLSFSIVFGILFLVVLIKGAIWLFKIVGNLALLR